jgi:hypothetical protein
VTARRRDLEQGLDAGPGARAVACVPALRELARGGIEARDAAPPTRSPSSPATTRPHPKRHDAFVQSGSRLAGLDTWAPSSSRSRRSREPRAPRPLGLEDVVARLSAPDRRATRAAAALALVAAGLTWEEVAVLRVASFLPSTSPPSVLVLEQPARRAGGWYAPIGEELLAVLVSWWALLPSRGAAFSGDSAKGGEDLRAEVLEVGRSRGLAVDVVALDRASRARRRLWRRRDGAGVVHEGSSPGQTTAPTAAAAERALYRAAIEALEPTIALQVEKVAALETAERELRAHYSGAAPGHCGSWTSAKPCSGEVTARWCGSCGEVVLRCTKHGGAAAAAVEIAERHAVPLGHVAAGVDVAALPALRAEARRLTEAG